MFLFQSVVLLQKFLKSPLYYCKIAPSEAFRLRSIAPESKWISSLGFPKLFAYRFGHPITFHSHLPFTSEANLSQEDMRQDVCCKFFPVILLRGPSSVLRAKGIWTCFFFCVNTKCLRKQEMFSEQCKFSSYSFFEPWAWLCVKLSLNLSKPCLF